VPKLIFEPTGRLGTTQALHTDDLAAAFCGAGDGPFLDMLVREAWEAAQRGTNLENACARATKAIKQTYREYGEIYQPGSCPIVDLVFGLKMHGNSKLFIANGPVINEKTEYISAGAGFYLADFLSDRMYKPYLPLNACVILAAYVLGAKAILPCCETKGSVGVWTLAESNSSPNSFNQQTGRSAAFFLMRLIFHMTISSSESWEPRA
jgi:hypothetical protein